ncbi:MAG: hypothetical protein CVU65_01370 [Deltaproteobacteria bacterium HGW-Deltaproteobacteria-22]|jgi:hypothetical protein|nr:MAG: hypothetical protein CVU65_01370 [Deltaproteobacteria bacterium HGW-Deltaproteobacteria-22]
MRRSVPLFLTILLLWASPAIAGLPWTGLPGRPVYDVMRTEVQLCNQFRCNGLRTGQVAFSGPSSGSEDICTMLEKAVVAPFFSYEGANYFSLLSGRGELWQFSHRLQLRNRFPNARFPSSHVLVLPEGRYFLVNNQESSVRQPAGTILWRNVYGKPSLWHPPLLVNDRLVIMHGNVKGSARSGRNAFAARAVVRAVAPASGKTIVEIPLPGVYTQRRYPPLSVLHTQTVVVPDAVGGLHAFSVSDLAAGKTRELWKAQVGHSEPLALVGDPATSRVIVAYGAGGRRFPNIIALDLKTGRKAWSVMHLDIATSLALYRNTLVFGTTAGKLRGLDVNTGASTIDLQVPTNLMSDREIIVMVVTEPVVDTLGRVYLTLGEVPRPQQMAFVDYPGTHLGRLKDSINAEVVGIQLTSRRAVYTSSLFQIDHAGSSQLIVGMETVGLFTSDQRLEFCAPETDE